MNYQHATVELNNQECTKDYSHKWYTQIMNIGY